MSWTAWSRFLMWSQGLVAALAILVIGLAVAVWVVDQSSHDDDWDGLGAFIAMFVGGIALAVLTVFVSLFLLTRRARRRAAGAAGFGELEGAAITTAVLSGSWLALCVASVTTGGMQADPLGLMLAAPAAPALIAAIGCLGALRPQSPD